MAILIPIFEQIEASLTASMADMKQRTEKVDALLADLMAEGIEFDVVLHCCQVAAHANSRARASFSIRLTDSPVESRVRPICKRNGSDWYICPESTTALIHVGGVALHIAGLTLDLTAERVA